MTKFREELLTRMIHLYGFEHKYVVNFATACENFPEDSCYSTVLEKLVENLEMCPVCDED